MKFNNSLEGTHSVVEKKKLVCPVRSIFFLKDLIIQRTEN